MKLISTLFLSLGFIVLMAQPPCPSGELSLVVSIQTDAFGYETSWEVVGVNGETYFEVLPDILSNNTLYETQVCIPEGTCVSVNIFDSYGDGIFDPGFYVLALEGDTLVQGGDFYFAESFSLNCAGGEVCELAEEVEIGQYTTSFDDHWYSFTPDSTGLYYVSTCGLDTCDTKIWMYDTCDGITVAEDNQSIIFFDDNESDCAPQAFVEAFLEFGVPYFIRIGDNMDACSDSITWEITYEGPITGCTDPNSCNFNPLATVDDGSCLFQGDPACPNSPDLMVRQDILKNTLYVDTISSTDPCLVEEGCLRGYGLRDILRFDTQIENIGELDYYIGEPSLDNSQFTFNNCHNHFHYDSYAEYVLYDTQGNEIPIGFKNGFCVLDLGCGPDGTAKYGCSNMGISAGCYDNYWAQLECQWIDITDIPDGDYIFVTRVNWLNAPDKLGRLEKDTLNNWAQACINIDRSTGSPEVLIKEECEPYIDCAGTPYGSAAVDCNGNCGGTALRGDFDSNGLQEMTDVEAYLDQILDPEATVTTCNDLNQDEAITVYDAALLSSCLNFGSNHQHEGSSSHDHCRFPSGILNTTDTVTLSIIDINREEEYIDIGMHNPTAQIHAYQFQMSGIQIRQVESLVDPDRYPMTPRAEMESAMIVGLSMQDSTITKSNEIQPLIRVHYMDLLEDFICIDEIIDIVNQDQEQVITRIENGCVERIISSTRSNLAELNVSLQPNPTNSKTLLSFSNPSNETYQLAIYHANGKLQYQVASLRGDQLEIDTQNWPVGIYQYHLVGDKAYAKGKLSVIR